MYANVIGITDFIDRRSVYRVYPFGPGDPDAESEDISSDQPQFDKLEIRATLEDKLSGKGSYLGYPVAIDIILTAKESEDGRQPEKAAVLHPVSVNSEDENHPTLFVKDVSGKEEAEKVVAFLINEIHSGVSAMYFTILTEEDRDDQAGAFKALCMTLRGMLHDAIHRNKLASEFRIPSPYRVWIQG